MPLTPWQLSLYPLVPNVSDQLLPMVDRMFGRIPDLEAQQVYTFKLDQDFISAICEGDQTQVDDQRNFSIRFSKHELSRYTYQADDFEQDLVRRRQIEEETGTYWEGQPTKYLYRFERLFLESEESRRTLIDLQNEYNARVLECWKNEIDAHVTGDYRIWGTDSPAAREQLLKRFAERQFADLGFTHDLKLTRKSILVYSKPLREPWVLFLAIERKLLAEPVQQTPTFVMKTNSMGRLTRPLGPRYVMCFGVANRKTRRALTFENEQVLLLQFQWFFPIRKAPLWSDYSAFYSLRELEALLNIHLIFFRILVPEFERAVQDGLNMPNTNEQISK